MLYDKWVSINLKHTVTKTICCCVMEALILMLCIILQTHWGSDVVTVNVS